MIWWGLIMKVVFLKKNNFVLYSFKNLNGYLFKPRNKNIKTLCVVNEKIIKDILSKKIKKEILRTNKTIKMMLRSDITVVSDCDMMIKELLKIAIKLEKKYKDYFSEFEYFNLVKELYQLDMSINLKKKILEETID